MTNGNTMNYKQTKLAGAAAIVGMAMAVGFGTGIRPAAAVTLHASVPHVSIMDDDHDWRWHRDHDRDNSYNWRWHRDHDRNVRVYHYRSHYSHTWYSQHDNHDRNRDHNGNDDRNHDRDYNH